MAQVEAKAPGKLILSGEHAVVHGCPALVAAVNRMAVCRITSSRDDCFKIVAPQFCETIQVTHEDLMRNYRQLRADYERFRQGEIPISNVVRESGMLLLFAIAEALDAVEVPGMTVRVDTDIPVCCGMGSSAAVTASMIVAIRKTYDLPVKQDVLYAKTMECEKLQHGNPSGVDAYASIYGGILLYRRGQPIQDVNVGLPVCQLVHTGVPQASTGECVMAVHDAFNHPERRKQFTETTLGIRQALEEKNPSDLQKGVRRNHDLLKGIGVVPERVTQFISEVEEMGGAAKICGAGSVRGDGAGMVWVIMPNESLRGLEMLLEKYKYTQLCCNAHAAGIRI